MTQHTAPSSDLGPHPSHTDYGIYIRVFIALSILTALSFWIGNTTMFEHRTADAAMIAISCAKALLVMLFFMHLLWEANWKYVLTVPAAMMATFLICMLFPDVGFRRAHYSEERRVFAAEVQASQNHHASGSAHESASAGEAH